MPRKPKTVGQLVSPTSRTITGGARGVNRRKRAGTWAFVGRGVMFRGHCKRKRVHPKTGDYKKTLKNIKVEREETQASWGGESLCVLKKSGGMPQQMRRVGALRTKSLDMVLEMKGVQAMVGLSLKKKAR